MVEQKNIRQIIDLWKLDKKQYVKKSTYSAYLLLIENHILPTFGDMYGIEEGDVQNFVFSKLNDGLSQKSIKDILIVLKMVLRFGVKHRYLNYQEICYSLHYMSNLLLILSKLNKEGPSNNFNCKVILLMRDFLI